MAFSVFAVSTPNTSLNHQLVNYPLPASTENTDDADKNSSKDRGGFIYDNLSSTFDLKWTSRSEFMRWLDEEQRSKCYELKLQKTYTGSKFSQKLRYVCGRQRTGGEKEYQKQSQRSRKIDEPKLIGCPCSLIVKTYPDTEVVLGYFTGGHSHPLGEDNLRFTYIPPSDRERILEMIRQHVELDYIVKHMNEGIFSRTDTGDGLAGGAVICRTSLITRSDVLRLKKQYESQIIRLDPDDGESVDHWICNLQQEGAVLAYKNCASTSPFNSGISDNAFVLVLQTEWQRARAQEFGSAMLHIDGTHNVTCYQNMNLYTILGRDKQGKGVPLAWCLASEGTQNMHQFFLKTFREANPTVSPKFFMSDKDRPQMNAIGITYTDTQLLLCWWHVLHAWQQHFNIHAFPILWQKLKEWIRVTDEEEFNAYWVDIQELAPASFCEYLKCHWMEEQRYWSAVHRKGRTIDELSDTNMLIEAWHHTLKSVFLHGKRNRRLDHLISVLIREVCPYFAIRFHRNRLGFEGPSLETRKRLDVKTRGQHISPESITVITDGLLEVQSQTKASVVYRVSVSPTDCSCNDFPLIRFCKHVYAAQIHHPNLAWDTAQDKEQDLLGKQNIIGNNSFSSMPRSAQDDMDLKASSELSQLKKTVIEINRLADLLSIRSSLPGASQTFNVEKLVAVETLLQDALLDSSLKQQLLPNAERLPPNKRTKTETAEAYGRKVPHEKTKRKSQHTDPYCGGERSGKKAKLDALNTDNPQPPTQTRPKSPQLNPNIPQRNPANITASSLPHPATPAHSNAPTHPIPQQTHVVPAPMGLYYYYPPQYYAPYPVYSPYGPHAPLIQHPDVHNPGLHQTPSHIFLDPLRPPVNNA